MKEIDILFSRRSYFAFVRKGTDKKNGSECLWNKDEISPTSLFSCFSGHITPWRYFFAQERKTAFKLANPAKFAIAKSLYLFQIAQFRQKF